MVHMSTSLLSEGLQFPAVFVLLQPPTTQASTKESLTHGQSPAEPKQLPGCARRVPDDKLDVPAASQLGMLAEGLDDKVTEAAVRVDRALVDLHDGLGKLGGSCRPMAVFEQLACVLAAGEGFETGYAVSGEWG